MRLAPLGLIDAANGDMFTDFETWEDETLWRALKSSYGVSGSGDSDSYS